MLSEPPAKWAQVSSVWLCATWEVVISENPLEGDVDESSVFSGSPVCSVFGLVDEVVKNTVGVETVASDPVELLTDWWVFIISTDGSVDPEAVVDSALKVVLVVKSVV